MAGINRDVIAFVKHQARGDALKEANDALLRATTDPGDRQRITGVLADMENQDASMARHFAHQIALKAVLAEEAKEDGDGD